jgi:HlyD family secretion protein
MSKGDQVVVGQPLFVLDPQPEVDKLVQAEFQVSQAKQQLADLEKGARWTIIKNIQAQIAQAKASQDFAKKTFRRYKLLYSIGSIDKAQLDDATSQYQQSIEQVKALEAQLADAMLGSRINQILAQRAVVEEARAAAKAAKWALLQKSVRAKKAAQVYDVVYESGEFIGAGQPAVVLLPPDKIKIIFFVPEKILSQVAVGQEVIIDCDNCKNSYKAKIDFISSSIEYTPPVIFSQESKDKLVYKAEAKMPVWVAKKFHPGQPVDVVIEKSTLEKTTSNAK